jgi:hypothetical protein
MAKCKISSEGPPNNPQLFGLHITDGEINRRFDIKLL